MGQRITTRHQQFQRVVKTGRVGLTLDNQWPQFVQILAQQFRRHRRVACRHPVHIAAQRVDFAIVRNHAERMRQIPGGKSIGGETLVYQRQCGNYAFVLQVRVILADLIGQQHALVNQRARGQRRNIKTAPLPISQTANPVLRRLADDKQLAFETVSVPAIFTASNEYLAHCRFNRLDALAQTAVVHRHIAPAKQFLSLGRDFVGEHFLACSACRGIAWQEQHPHTVFARRRQGHPLCRTRLAQKLIGNLN